MHALLELDCIPSGMELFPAANETQWDLIKRVIDDCDYYLLILGGRYGSIGPEGISYTEMEYNYALSVGKPTIAFLHKSPGKIESDRCEQLEEGRRKLKAFREIVETKLCKHWVSADELGSVVSRSLVQLIKREPEIGWVRANELADRDATVELLKLRRQVDELKKELATARTSAPKGTENLAQGEDNHLIQYTFRTKSRYSYLDDSTNWEDSFQASWNDIFSCISPLMIHEASNPQIESTLGSFSKERNIDQLREDGRIRNQIGNVGLLDFKIKPDNFQTIIVQMRALGLITKSEKTRSVKDTETYWTLTPYGDNIMTRLRAIRRDHKEESEVDIKKENDDAI